MLRSKDQAPAAAKAALIAAVEEEVQLLKQDPAWSSLFTSEPPSGQVAGYHVMLGRLVSNVLRDQWKCLLLAALGMLVAIALATRSVIYAVAAVITNVLPVLVVLGALGWSGTKANMGVAMIAAVSLGLSVDSSIHYLVHFRRRVSSGTKRLKALRSAQETVGLAVVLSTMALVTGFLSLCTSEFAPTVVFGTLASLTLFGALLGNLIVLPLLIGQRLESKGANG